MFRSEFKNQDDDAVVSASSGMSAMARSGLCARGFFCHPASEAIWGIFDPHEISGRGTRRDHLRVLLQTGLATDQDFARIDDLFAATLSGQ